MEVSALVTLLGVAVAALAVDSWRRQGRRADILDRLDRVVVPSSAWTLTRRQWRVVWVTVGIAACLWFLASVDLYLGISSRRVPFFRDLTFAVLGLGALRVWMLRGRA